MRGTERAQRPNPGVGVKGSRAVWVAGLRVVQVPELVCGSRGILNRFIVPRNHGPSASTKPDCTHFRAAPPSIWHACAPAASRPQAQQDGQHNPVRHRHGVLAVFSLHCEPRALVHAPFQRLCGALAGRALKACVGARQRSGSAAADSRDRRLASCGCWYTGGAGPTKAAAAPSAPAPA